jgi:UDP-glucose:(glucosyl)LPS alpha-1,2-glucosyltransferase
MSNLDLMETNNLSANSKGGTELMLQRLYSGDIPRDLLKHFQIIPSRVRELKEDKVRILYLHDLPGDPESDHLKNGGWSRFHRLVFVSHWQAQRYIDFYQIPWSKCIVMQNAIDPSQRMIYFQPDPEQIKLVYHTTPHRGLDILVAVFEKLAEKYSQIHLDVYSSFKIYGWKDPQQYVDLFERIKAHSQMTYNEPIANDQIRKVLSEADIFAYPSVWTETSCISLMEAMSAGLMCVHPTLGALPETAANWTRMYRYHETPQQHANLFYAVLDGAIADRIEASQYPDYNTQLRGQQSYANLFYSWEMRKYQWISFLESIKDEPTKIIKPTGPMFIYNT